MSRVVNGLGNGRRLGLIALNIAILALFAYEVDLHWGWARLFAPWRSVPAAWLALATLAQALSYGLRALRIYLAERAVPRGAWFSCLRLILINNALNLLLPMRSGEASFPLLMQRWFGIGFMRAAGTLLWLRLLDLHVLASIGLLCVAENWIGHGAASAGFAVAGLLAMLAPPILFAINRPLSRLFAAREGRLARSIAQVLDGLPARRRGLGLDLLLSWSAWGIKLAALGWLLMRLAGIPFAAGVLGAIGGDLSTVLPVHTPGGFGTYEAGVIAALALDASPLPALLAAAVNLHLFVLTVALLGGALAWLCGGQVRQAAKLSG